MANQPLVVHGERRRSVRSAALPPFHFFYFMEGQIRRGGSAVILIGCDATVLYGHLV